MNPPYTHTELIEMKRRLNESLARIEREHPDIRPLPPMTEEEAYDLLTAWFDTAATRILDQDECALMGQLLACFRQAVTAGALGYKGRYFVISEADLRSNFKFSPD